MMCWIEQGTGLRYGHSRVCRRRTVWLHPDSYGDTVDAAPDA